MTPRQLSTTPRQGKRSKLKSGPEPAPPEELSILLGCYGFNKTHERCLLEMDELRELTRTLGFTRVHTEVIRIQVPVSSTLFGSGTVARLGDFITTNAVASVYSNENLSPRQQRNLERAWNCPVVDRTEVILDIFGQRATTAEGRIQVEMAQLEHELPRLAGGWTHLERQRGGVGIRGGAGEQQIEVDRRLIGERLKKLRKELKTLARQRETQRSARHSVPLACCALIGYTNAGKSTLLNALTNSEVYADNRLFATLDPTSRVMGFSSGRRMILTDTVGFIQNLPTELVEAFTSTLEEVTAANIHAILVDISHPDVRAHLETVVATLNDLNCTQPRMLIINKCDQVDVLKRNAIIQDLFSLVPVRPIVISALNRTGFDDLKAQLDAVAAEVVPETVANRPYIVPQPTDTEH